MIRYLPVKTGAMASMACTPFLMHSQKKCVSVTVKMDAMNSLEVTRFLAFHPELLPRTTPKVCFASLNRFLKRYLVHPPHHQNPTGGLFLNYSRNKAGGVKFQMIPKVHAGPILRVNIGICEQKTLPISP